jgi:hypothetical protein
VRSYFTAAWVAEVSVTSSTLDVTAAASGLAENDLMADVKSCPSCSSVTRSLFGVDELKNLTQLALISVIAWTPAIEPPPLPPPFVAEGDDGAADDAAVLAVAAEEELELLLEHAASAATSSRARAGASKARRAW